MIVETTHKPRKGLKKTLMKRSSTKLARKPLKRVQRKIKPSSISKLKKELDAVFSRFIRERDQGQCYTCLNKGEIKKMQNGHFIPRQYLSTRWDEVNNHCQCYACNMLYNGQPGAYAVRLEIDYGAGTVAGLEARRKDVVKMKPADYLELILHYKALLTTL